jgi:two-component system phosphate regulon sensor histidine kinase PhoR
MPPIFAVNLFLMSSSRRPEKLRLSAILMVLAIIGVAVFQGYWINKLYNEEWNNLEKETDIALRDVVYKLQIQHFGKDTGFVARHLLKLPGLPTGKDTQMHVFTIAFDSKNTKMPPDVPDGPLPSTMRYMSSDGGVGIGPPSIGQIDSAYRLEMRKSQINLPFTIQRVPGKEEELQHPAPAGQLQPRFIFVGPLGAFAYQASFGNPVRYLLTRIRLPIIMSLLLMAFTTAAFIFMYRNLAEQQRLAAAKSDFISNMTHELKTPIATVNVAVEALRHFDALSDPVRTREYLDISALELQRLSMLVDKVLKLSLFENKEIEINRTNLDIHELAAEVITGMKLSFEKAGATVALTPAGEPFLVKADRMHMTSVLTNLLDNALKYGKASPVITVHLSRTADSVIIAVTDNGIGIPAAYASRVFEKFFRVPSGDHHNIKGYGLGLSYVHHIVTRHNGSIAVDSKEGKGSTFTIRLPASMAHSSPYQSPTS